MYNVGEIISVKGIAEPVTIIDIIRAGAMIGYAGKYTKSGIEMTISWIPLALIKPF
jgi:hypothetical protein